MIDDHGVLWERLSQHAGFHTFALEGHN